jgi:hypothetical protein
LTLNNLKALFVDAGCRELYAKPLAENDNSKNQVYFGPDFQALNLFPNSGILPDSSTKNPIFKAKLRFEWLLEDGRTSEAPGAQLILYPQYPEVRFSGFLKGCGGAPSDLMAGRIPGRVLFLGVTPDRRVLGFVVGRDSEIAAEFHASRFETKSGVFFRVTLPLLTGGEDSRTRLLAELKRIHNRGWIDSKQLDSAGMLKPCNAPQCGGFTLEAELGIPKNSAAEPDFLGWEVKQHSVTNFDRVEVGVITLMTPEPTGGFYAEHGLAAFVRRFGYADKKGRPDRLNFGGIYRTGSLHPFTRLALGLTGYDAREGRILDPDGAVALLTAAGEVAAAWDFAGLLKHWTRKHANAVYVPSQCRKEPKRQYCYGHKVRLAQGTDFLRLLKALADGAVYYDPGIKLERVSTSRPLQKGRSQFRIASKNISGLYQTLDLVSL